MHVLRFILFSVVFLVFSIGVGYAQVGIGTTNPNQHAALDINGTEGGLLMPRVALTATNNAAPLGGHVAGMTVYNTATAGGGATRVTPGFYYNDGGQWVRFANGGDIKAGWELTGNAGTAPATNFLGTTDNQALRIKTNNQDAFEISAGNNNARGRLRAMTDGSAAQPSYSWTSNIGMGMYRIGNNILGVATNGNERMRITANGNVGINTAGAGALWTDFALTGQALALMGGGIAGNGPNDLGVYGQSSTFVGAQGLSVDGIAGLVGTTTTTGSADGVWGLTVTNGADGVYGEKNGGVGNGVFGNSSNVGVSGLGPHGGLFEGRHNEGYGVIAWNTTTSGDRRVGLHAIGQGLDLRGFPGTGALLYGRESGAAAFADDIDGTGIRAVGNKGGNTYTAIQGAGVAGTGSYVGTFGTSTRGADGIGVLGVGNDEENYALPLDGAGVAGTGTLVGVYGYAVDEAGGFGVYSSGDLGVGGDGYFTGVVYAAGPIVAPRGIATDILSVDDTEMVVDGAIYGESVTASGNLSAAGTKNFQIDHPLDPANKYLKHASVESNEILNLYRGTAVFDADGLAQVHLPDYYSEINQHETYQLTPIGAAMPNLYIAEKVSNNRFVIGGGVAGKEVSWTVTAERNDAYVRSNPAIREMEVDKKENRGRYMSPEAYGKTKEQGILNGKFAEQKATVKKLREIEVNKYQTQKESLLEVSQEEVLNLVGPLKEVKNPEVIKRIQNSYRSTNTSANSSSSASSSESFQEQSNSEVAPSESQNSLQQQETPRMDHKN